MANLLNKQFTIKNNLETVINGMMKKNEVEESKKGSSRNSYNHDSKSATSLMQKKIKELKLEMPPTRQTLQKLFESLNLILPAVRAIECILFCRGLKMEKSEPLEF